MAVSDITIRPLEWLRRYLPAEGAGLVATLVCTLVTLQLSGNILFAALAGTWGECVVYYGVMVWRELRGRGPLTHHAALATLRNLLLEFGPAELLDNMLVRPGALATALALVPIPTLGTLLGKLVADGVFYMTTIVSYELLRRRGAGR